MQVLFLPADLGRWREMAMIDQGEGENKRFAYQETASFLTLTPIDFALATAKMFTKINFEEGEINGV